MSIAVVVDRASFARTPDKNEQVALPIAFIDEVTSVASGIISHRKFLPATLVGLVFFHQPLQVVDIDIIRSQARGRSKTIFQV